MSFTSFIFLAQLAVLGHPDPALYDPDPHHLCNRLYRALYTRRTPNGTIYDQESLEPPFYGTSRFLRDGAFGEQAAQVLDEFLSAGSEKLPRDPVARALLQRDLWTVFSATVETRALDGHGSQQRRELQRRLVQAMRRLALTQEEMQSLPDNLAAAARSGRFASRYDPQAPDRAFLPDDLLNEKGPWVVLSYPFGSEHLAAPIHTRQAKGASAFIVLLRFPGGRQQTEDYLAALPQGRSTPQIPRGTQVALLRRMMHVECGGTLCPTPITESLQIRVSEQLKRPDTYEFTLRRKELLGGRSGGLVPTGPDETEYFSFLGGQDDSFETIPARTPMATMKSCISCHGGEGIGDFQSLTSHAHGGVHVLASDTLRGQLESTRSEINTTYAWGLLQGLWEAR